MNNNVNKDVISNSFTILNLLLFQMVFSFKKIAYLKMEHILIMSRLA